MTRDELTRRFVSEFRWGEGQVRAALRADFCCEYCGRDLLASVDDYDAWQLDHVVPRSKGGGDDDDNMAIACKTCNFMKRNIHFPDLEGVKLTRDQRIAFARRQTQSARAKKLMEIAQMRLMINEMKAAEQASSRDQPS